MRQQKQPAFQFYPGDWLKDPALSLCSIEARGCYIDLLCVLHEMEFRGVFRIKNEAISIEKISKFSRGAKPKHVKELIALGVLKIAKRSGCVFSARLVRDGVYTKRLSRKRSKSGSNGNAKRWQSESQTNRKGVANASQTHRSSSSSSSSYKEDIYIPPTPQDKNQPAQGYDETAVGVYLDVLKNEKYLNAVTWSMIEENIIKSPKSFAFWRKLVTAWAANGWNPRNVQGMIECYKRREIPKGKSAPVQPEPEGVKDEMTPEELARISARRKELKAILAANKAKAAEEAAKAEAEKAKGE